MYDLAKYSYERYGLNLLKYLYDWVLSWANTPFGLYALFILAFAEASFFPIPPDVLLIALVLGSHKKYFKFTIYTFLGSVLGGILGYFIGSYLWYNNGNFSSIALFFFNNIPGFTIDVFNHTKQLYDKYSFMIVFTAGFTPIPYKVITITAGVAKIDFLIFIIASAISRFSRFFLVSFLIYKFGEPINNFINKWFNILTIIFVLLLFGGFYVLKYIY